MKIIAVFVLSSLLILFMFGCKEQAIDPPETNEKAHVTQEQADNLRHSLTLVLSVLKEDQPFYSASSKADMRISDYHRNIWQFASVDLDSDDKNEIAVMFEDGSILILTKEGNSVIGFDFEFHAMYQINRDGSYMWKANAGNTYGSSRLRLLENGYEAIELWRVEHDGAGAVSYYVDGKTVSQEVFQAASANNNQESVAWTPWADFQ